MEYKNYIGMVEYDDQAKLFHGDVINIKTVITFQGKSVDEIEQAFCDSIDDYIAWCKEDGAAPEQPYSGKFNLQLSPNLHKEVAVMAKKLKLSVDSFVEKALVDEINACKML
jgi:predicted HicB family RNase H-like nuclease